MVAHVRFQHIFLKLEIANTISAKIYDFEIFLQMQWFEWELGKLIICQI